MTTELETPIDAVVLTSDLTTELEKVDINKVHIALYAQQYAAITINGPTDNKGLEEARKARRVLVGTRTAIEQAREGAKFQSSF